MQNKIDVKVLATFPADDYWMLSDEEIKALYNHLNVEKGYLESTERGFGKIAKKLDEIETKCYVLKSFGEHRRNLKLA